LALALAAVRNTCLNLLLFGLLGPVATSAVALLIASFAWSPTEAALPVPVLLTLNAGATLIWGALTARQSVRSRRSNASPGKTVVRFSLRSLLCLVTIACLLLALSRQLPRGAEMLWFAAYGIGVLALALAMGMWFSYRVKRRVLQGKGLP
jgi:hypothetical protein